MRQRMVPRTAHDTLEQAAVVELRPGARETGWLQRYMTIGHGVFFLVSGLWPLFGINTFQKVTGPKVDTWLVKTVGTLIAVAGAVLVYSGVRRGAQPEAKMIATGISGSLGAISGYYATKGRISKIYYLDALLESIILALWALAPMLERRAERRKRAVSATPVSTTSQHHVPAPAATRPAEIRAVGE